MVSSVQGLCNGIYPQDMAPEINLYGTSTEFLQFFLGPEIPTVFFGEFSSQKKASTRPGKRLQFANWKMAI